MTDSARAPLNFPERWGAILTFVLLILFGGLVEMRSVFLKEDRNGERQQRRMGDWGCYVRGAWSVYAGAKLYDVPDDNDWHYNYPPFFAIMLVPLADPPAQFRPAPLMPYEISVGLWYYVSLGFGILALLVLARAIEEHSRDPQVSGQPPGCRRWWALRILPLYFCLLPFGHTLMRGQVNLLILALFCLMIAAFLRQRSFRAGVWLSIACSIKVIPVFLMVYPLVRRDWRCLGGLAAGFAVTLVAMPLLVWGPSGTVDVYHDFYKTLLEPALQLHEDKLNALDKSRVDELTGPGLTDNQSLKFALFNVTHPGERVPPDKLPVWAKTTWVVLGVGMTFITLLAGYRTGFRRDSSLVLFFGALIFLMSVLSPVCHLHYFTYTLPMIMGLLAQHWERRGDLNIPWTLLALFALFFVANLLPHFQSLSVIRDVGLPLYAALGIWVTAMVRLWNSGTANKSADVLPPALRAA